MRWLIVVLVGLFFLAPVAGSSQYTIEISSPSNDEPIRENTGNITISVSVAPGLSGDHTIRITMDGGVISSGRGSYVSLTNVDRGTHTVAASLLGAGGEVIARSPTVTFHLLRASKN